MIHAPEEPMRIACFGQAGSYTYEAMQENDNILKIYER